MRVLIVGGGGREHALAWKLAREKGIFEVFVAPGNPGIALEPKVVCTGLAASDFSGMLRLCRSHKIGFVVVGPDQALADGAVDFFEQEGIPAFGPTQSAARIESSKAFAKEIMRHAGIPTARFEVFADAAPARDFLTRVEWGKGWVVKADGLALGKGVVVCESREEALSVVNEFMLHAAVGPAGKQIVIEERLQGKEVSSFFFCDGGKATILGSACDYKRILEGDKGANTGGMGAYSPADWLDEGFTERVSAEIVRPLLAAMAERGHPFKGILFVGLMVTAAGPKVIEFNARFGDPETQALLPLLDENLLPWLEACRNGKLDSLPATGPKMKPLTASVHVVLAAAGYPGANVKKGDIIRVPPELLPQEEEGERLAKLFFAGVARSRSLEMTTSGGRVLGLTALASTRAEARAKAHALVSAITFAGAQRRADVGA
ncbi:MAG: phosphoribosylamine--glycine ligase [Bacteriovoracia bacterium]